MDESPQEDMIKDLQTGIKVLRAQCEIYKEALENIKNRTTQVKIVGMSGVDKLILFESLHDWSKNALEQAKIAYK